MHEVQAWKVLLARKGLTAASGMKAARIFNPQVHVMGKKIGLVDIDDMKLFKLNKHLDIRPCLDGMQTEISRYNELVQRIKPFDEREDARRNQVFVLSD